MPLGPGKFDDLCTYALQKAQAESAALIIFGGKERGSGFSVQGTAEALITLPQTLRAMATEVERSLVNDPQVRELFKAYKESLSAVDFAKVSSRVFKPEPEQE